MEIKSTIMRKKNIVENHGDKIEEIFLSLKQNKKWYKIGEGT